ncbi:hypothetical protein OPV22_032305 [Ensete ventricosum]|uniref:Uncharacterized protein n=1 Tax=Ensete ventricosum TaxID=4639 RepID=A0AAV8PR87_ENSVE|nr:hypothetical protein OPV22_032305 [Ensete ventricosum]
MQSAALKEPEHGRRSSRFAPRFSSISQQFSEDGEDHERSLSVAALKAIVDHLKDYGWRLRSLRSGFGIKCMLKELKSFVKTRKKKMILLVTDKNNVVGESSVKD